MSNTQPEANGSSDIDRNPFVSLREEIIKDTMTFFGWIAALLLVAGICWAITQPIRNRFLVRAVNRVLAESGDARRLGEPAPSGANGSLLGGAWFTITGGTGVEGRVFIFSFIGEGTFFPCAAVMTRDGKLMEFIPLNSHGGRVIRRIPQGILNIYAKRIEGAVL